MIFNAKRKLRKEKDINIRLTAIVVGFKHYYVPKECVCGALMVCLWYMEVRLFQKVHYKVRLFFVLVHFVKVLVSKSTVIKFVVVWSDTSDNRILNFWPFASNVWWFVVVTGTCGEVFWEWDHVKDFSVGVSVWCTAKILIEPLNVGPEMDRK